MKRARENDASITRPMNRSLRLWAAERGYRSRTVPAGAEPFGGDFPVAIVLCRKGTYLWSYDDGYLRYVRKAGRSARTWARKFGVLPGVRIRTWDDGEIEVMVRFEAWTNEHACAFGVLRRRVLSESARATLTAALLNASRARKATSSQRSGAGNGDFQGAGQAAVAPLSPDPARDAG